MDVNADAEVVITASASQQHDSEDQPPDENPEQNWLTIRRRCELCKQRKVCGSAAITTRIHLRTGFMKP